MRALNRCINIADFRALAQRRIFSLIFDFVDGETEEEATMARNHAFLADWSLVPNQMHGVSKVDASTALTGQRVGWPFTAPSR
jgi:L-lactate dehydrogenase (cytochrome)